jgi:serine protease Do
MCTSRINVVAATLLALALFVASPVAADTAGRALGIGHGFFVDGNGHVLTSRHIVQNCAAIELSSPTLATRPAKLRALPDRYAVDLALLRTSPIDAEVLAFRDTWPEPAPPSGWVSQIAKPIRGTLMAYARGNDDPAATPLHIVANRHSAPDIKMLVLQGTVVPGQSGSPITDDEGRVIGIAFAQLKADNPLKRMMRNQPGGYAMAAREAIDFLAGNGITAASGAPTARSAERAEALVRVQCLQVPRPVRLIEHAHRS